MNKEELGRVIRAARGRIGDESEGRRNSGRFRPSSWQVSCSVPLSRAGIDVAPV